ncbi:MAG: MBL fold metallo-hydrolase [Bacteroidia bacterium]|nr:MBL fold metallo-hydrolase [Bacteroidia bacterium]
MKLTFLGTGTSQGIPVIGCNCGVCTSADPKDNRLRTSALLNQGDTWVVFDTGPDFRQQMLRATPPHLDAVIYTHEHRDHTAGLDDIRPFYFKQGAAIEVYGGKGCLKALKNQFGYVFEESPYPGAPRVNIHTVNESPFQIGEMTIQPVPVLHYRLPVMGYRIGDLAYVTDANFIPETSKARLQNLKVLVLNSLRKERHMSHFNLEEAVDLIRQLKPERAYLTHLSHLMGKHQDVSPELPDNIFIAWDGLEIEV